MPAQERSVDLITNAVLPDYQITEGIFTLQSPPDDLLGSEGIAPEPWNSRSHFSEDPQKVAMSSLPLRDSSFSTSELRVRIATISHLFS